MRVLVVRLAILVAVLAAGCVSSGFGPAALVESERAASPVTARTLKGMQADVPPKITARAAVMMDESTGQVVYERNSHERRAQASTTKIMTALVTLENARLTDVVTAGPDVKVEPSVIGLDPGDRLTVEQLLYGLLLPSGNDAAVDLAEYVAGSIPRFATMMNAKAAELGLKDTHFVTPHGLDADGHYSSAYDLAVLARAAMQNPVFARIVATPEYRIEGPVRWYFKNNNRLLAVYPGADGIKTGYTDNAGHCLVFSATRGGHRGIVVVLDSEDSFADAAALMDYFFANFTWISLPPAGGPLGSYDRNGAVRSSVARSRPSIVLPKWERDYLRWFFSLSPDAAASDGSIGHVTYSFLGRQVADVPLYPEGN